MLPIVENPLYQGSLWQEALHGRDAAIKTQKDIIKIQEDIIKAMDHKNHCQELVNIDLNKKIDSLNAKISKMECRNKLKFYLTLATKVICIALLGFYFKKVGWKKIVDGMFLSSIRIFKSVS